MEFSDEKHRSFSIKLWPPSQSTRSMLVQRMTTNLSTPSFFSRKYGLLGAEEAEKNAKEIEELAFVLADKQHNTEPDGDGSAAVHIYAKESSKLMIEILKKGPGLKEESQTLEKVSLPSSVFDISGGPRAFIDANEAKDLLKPLGEPGNFYTKICFSNRSFDIGAARIAEPILKSIRTQLTEVDLSDFVAGRPEDEALEVMSIFSSSLEGSNLKCLNLSNNALGEKGVRAFGDLLKSQRNLEELYLINNGISEEAARAVCELIPSTEKLRVLQFHNNMTGDEGAVAISDVLKCSGALEDFRCSSTRVDSEGGIALCKALETCTKLKRLDLRDNMFGPEVGICLSKTLSFHAGLTEVYLSYLNLEDEATIAIANVLGESAPSLQVLDIAGNDLTIKAVPALATCIGKKPFLTKLNLSENELKDEGSILISKALEGHLQLKEIDMSSCSIRRVGARVLAQVVAYVSEFVLLNINGNSISEEGIDEVKEILKSGKNSVDVLGPLDENDAEDEEISETEGAEDQEISETKGAEEETEIVSKLQELNVHQE